MRREAHLRSTPLKTPQNSKFAETYHCQTSKARTPMPTRTKKPISRLLVPFRRDVWELAPLESRPVEVWEPSALTLPSESGVDRPSKFGGGFSVCLEGVDVGVRRGWRRNPEYLFQPGRDSRRQCVRGVWCDEVGRLSLFYPNREMRLMTYTPHARSTMHRTAHWRAFSMPQLLPRALLLLYSHPNSTSRWWRESSRPQIGGHLAHGNDTFKMSFR